MYWARHLVKLLKAVDLIGRPQGATIDELAEHLEVNKRTAYRMIETMDEMNFPFFEDTSSLDGKKHYQFEASYLKKLPNLSVPELRLSLSEIIALSFIRGGGGPFKGTDVEKNIESAFKKMDAFIPEKFVTAAGQGADPLLRLRAGSRRTTATRRRSSAPSPTRCSSSRPASWSTTPSATTR